jgi:hypothetical protein
MPRESVLTREIRKHALAESDLIGIWEYTFHEWDAAQADKYLDELDDGISATGRSTLPTFNGVLPRQPVRQWVLSLRATSGHGPASRSVIGRFSIPETNARHSLRTSVQRRQ